MLTFLLVDRQSLFLTWEIERLAIRRQYLPDGRRMAFKNLSDGHRRRALDPFLSAAAGITGIVFSIAIDKNVELNRLGGVGFEQLKTRIKNHKILEKMVNVGAYGALLTGGLCAPGQDLFWLTDNDDIVINQNRLEATRIIFRHMLDQFCPQGLGKVRFATTGDLSNSGDHLRAEDLCSIPDLVGGAIADHLTSIKGIIPGSGNLAIPMVDQRTKTAQILRWLSNLDGPLKHLVCVVKSAGPDQRRYSFHRYIPISLGLIAPR